MTVPLTESEYWAVVHRARHLGVARSEYVRRAMFGYYEDGWGFVPYHSWAVDEQESTPDDKRPA